MLDMASTLDYYGVDYHPGRTTQKVLCPVHGEMDPSCNVDMEKGLWYCLPPETRVLTDDLRYVQLSEVQVGDVLAGFDEEPSAQAGRSRRRHWREAVVRSVERIEQPCYEIRLSNGDVLTSSSGSTSGSARTLGMLATLRRPWMGRGATSTAARRRRCT